MKKEDLRVVKTKKNLYDSLLNLLKNDSFDSIKVSDICGKANINRSTFYDHFNDKYELLISLFNYLQLDFSNNNINLENISSLKEYFMELIRNLIKHFRINKDSYVSIIKNINNISFDVLISIISNEINDAFDKFQGDDLEIPRNVFITYFISAIISVCQEYLLNSSIYSEDEIINYLEKLIKF